MEIEIVLPVNPTGYSFIKKMFGYFYRAGIDLRQNKDLQKALKKLQIELAKLVGADTPVTFKLVYDEEKKLLIIKDICVWKPEKLEGKEIKIGLSEE